MSEKRICPKCGSKNISPDFSPAAYGKGAFFNSYICNDCGYGGEFFPEVKKKK